MYDKTNISDFNFLYTFIDIKYIAYGTKLFKGFRVEGVGKEMKKTVNFSKQEGIVRVEYEGLGLKGAEV